MRGRGLQALPVLRLGQTMAAVEFRCRLQYHLLIPMYRAGSRCPRCSGIMDRWGDHAVQCRVGVGVANTFRHNAIRDLILRIGRELSLPVGREPSFPVQVPGLETRRADLVIRDWEHGRDLFVDVVGTSPLARSYRAGFVPGGAVAKAALHKMVAYMDVLRGQPPRVVFRPFAFDTLGGLHQEAIDLLARLQGIVGQVSLAHEDFVWYSIFQSVSFSIARAVGRQLSTRLPLGGVGDFS